MFTNEFKEEMIKKALELGMKKKVYDKNKPNEEVYYSIDIVINKVNLYTVEFTEDLSYAQVIRDMNFISDVSIEECLETVKYLKLLKRLDS